MIHWKACKALVGGSILIMALLMGGCQNSDNSQSSSTDSPVLDTASPQEMNILCEDGPPFQIVNADGTLSGLTVEVVQELQRRVGNTDIIQVVPWARGYEEILNEPNTILFSMARTKERNELFHWVGPISESLFGFYGRADSEIKINSLEDAKQVSSIGVYQNDVRDVFLTEAGFTNLDRSNDPVQNFRKLMEGRVELLAESNNAVYSNAQLTGYAPEDVELLYVFMKSQLYIAISKETDAAKVKEWQDAFQSMQEDGSFKAIYRKYFPKEPLPGPPVIS